MHEWSLYFARLCNFNVLVAEISLVFQLHPRPLFTFQNIQFLCGHVLSARTFSIKWDFLPLCDFFFFCLPPFPLLGCYNGCAEKIPITLAMLMLDLQHLLDVHMEIFFQRMLQGQSGYWYLRFYGFFSLRPSVRQSPMSWPFLLTQRHAKFVVRS